MAEITVLPGVERRDLAGEPMPAHEVLQEAIDNCVTDVVVVGRDRQGNVYIATAGGDVDKVVGQLVTAQIFLAGSMIRSVEAP